MVEKKFVTWKIFFLRMNVWKFSGYCTLLLIEDVVFCQNKTENLSVAAVQLFYIYGKFFQLYQKG